MTSALIAAASDAGLTIVVRDPAETAPLALPLRPQRHRHHARGPGGLTGFGVQLPRRHIRDGWLGYGICHRDAVDALCAAWQVTVIDPEWGRPDVLWRVLEQAIQPAGGTS